MDEAIVACSKIGAAVVFGIAGGWFLTGPIKVYPRLKLVSKVLGAFLVVLSLLVLNRARFDTVTHDEDTSVTLMRTVAAVLAVALVWAHRRAIARGKSDAEKPTR